MYQLLVAFILNYGHTSMSCKTLVSESFPSEVLVSKRVNEVSFINDVKKYVPITLL